MLNFNYSAPVAQLDRASGYEPEGREFESLRAHHYFRPLAETRRSRVPRRGGLRAHHFSCHVFCLRPAIGIHKTFLHRFHERSLAAPLPAQFRRNQIHQEPRTLEAGPQRRICDTIRSDAPRKLSEIRKGKRPDFRIAQKAASVAQFDRVRPLAETRRSRVPRRGGLRAHHSPAMFFVYVLQSESTQTFNFRQPNSPAFLPAPRRRVQYLREKRTRLAGGCTRFCTE